MEEKTNKLIVNYLKHAEKHISENKKEFSSFNTIYHRFIKKDTYDPSLEYTKEIIKRMEKDKVTSSQAMEISEYLMPQIQGFKKEVLMMIIPIIVGILCILIFSILLITSLPYETNNIFDLSYSAGAGFGLGCFLFGFLQRNRVKVNTLSKSMLFQAGSSFGAAKMQGQGSFAAFRILDEMRAKQGKEMQIKVNQPKVVYKR